MSDPRLDPQDPARRPPLDRALPFPPEGKVAHPNLKEHLYANLRADQVVLDVGCGTGPFEYADYQARFLAFDMFEPTDRAGMIAGRDEFHLGRLETFPFPDASCDAVILGFILEHVREPQAFLREAERVLRPGGWVYVAVPNGYSLEDGLFRLATSVAGSTRGPHIQQFSYASFEALVRAHTGLQIAAWHPLRASWLWLAHPKLRVLRAPWLAVLRAFCAIGLDGFSNANFQFLLRKP